LYPNLKLFPPEKHTPHTGEEKNVLAALFTNVEESPCNVKFRAHLYHAENIMNFFLLVPFLLLLSWGYNLSYLYQPPGAPLSQTIRIYQ
jgi:hypothetical protein